MKLRKDFLYLSAIVILIGICGQFYYDYRYGPAHEIQVYYSQDIEANKKVTEIIRDADQRVYFAIYTFTRTDIKDALLGAKYRGLDVRGIVDREQTDRIKEQQKIVSELEVAGIPIGFDDHSGIMHLKTVVTEKAYATGSYNWTASATTINDEVLEIGNTPAVRDQYERVVRELFDRYLK
jgi:phosphatidylserine/phosphatidylglycerophosphate/cardiolipin synthase-like enzyme